MIGGNRKKEIITVPRGCDQACQTVIQKRNHIPLVFRIAFVSCFVRHLGVNVHKVVVGVGDGLCDASAQVVAGSGGILCPDKIESDLAGKSGIYRGGCDHRPLQAPEILEGDLRLMPAAALGDQEIGGDFAMVRIFQRIVQDAVTVP